MRVVLDSAKLTHGLQVRGMHLTELADLAGVSAPTVSSAVAGRRINIRTALALARALNSRPIIAELVGLVQEDLPGRRAAQHLAIMAAAKPISSTEPS